MDTVGSFSLTLVPQTITVSRGARWVSIRNDSPYYLGIGCGPRAPVNLLTATSYPKTIMPWSGDNYDTAQIFAPFDGNVYLLSYIPGGVSSYLASVPQRAFVCLDTYGPSETPPSPYTGTPSSSVAQASYSLIGEYAPLTTGPQTVFFAGSEVAPSAIQLQSGQATIYLSAFLATVFGAALSAWALAIEFMTLNGGLTIMSSSPVWRFVLVNAPNVGGVVGQTFTAQPQATLRWTAPTPVFLAVGIQVFGGVGSNVNNVDVSTLFSLA